MGSSPTVTIILGVLLLTLLAGTGFLYWHYTIAKEDAHGYQEAYSKASSQLAEFNKVIISEDGKLSYPQARKLYVYGYATYRYELERAASIGAPEPLQRQSAFELCYTLEQNDNTFMIRLKNPYTQEFYKHCEGTYSFPIIVDDEEFSRFDIYLLPGPAS